VKLGNLIQIAAFALVGAAGCGDDNVVIVPTGTPVLDNFFVTWEIDSLAFGPVACESVGAATVDMDLVNVETGNRFVYSFDCRAYEGTSGPVDVGTFDVLLNLTDFGGGVLAQTDIGAQNVTIGGTIDLGHHIFQVP
jgi:hypothetical protein